MADGSVGSLVLLMNLMSRFVGYDSGSGSGSGAGTGGCHVGCSDGRWLK